MARTRASCLLSVTWPVISPSWVATVLSAELTPSKLSRIWWCSAPRAATRRRRARPPRRGCRGCRSARDHVSRRAWPHARRAARARSAAKAGRGGRAPRRSGGCGRPGRRARSTGPGTRRVVNRLFSVSNSCGLMLPSATGASTRGGRPACGRAGADTTPARRTRSPAPRLRPRPASGLSRRPSPPPRMASGTTPWRASAVASAAFECVSVSGSTLASTNTPTVPKTIPGA